MKRLPDQVAIVTGAAMGIGRATARRLAEEGARVLVADVQMDAARENVAAIRGAGGVAEAFRADVARHEDIEAMVKKAVALWGRLDILVNNAYGGTEGAAGGAEEVTPEGWDRAMAMLVKSMYLGAKYAVPQMRRSGSGSIVNIASVHGMLMAAGSLVYEAGKSAVIGLTRQMAVEYGPDGIRVNAICPGKIVTERSQESLDRYPLSRLFFQDQYPLRKLGRPLDIANAVVFLCSEEATFITGHSLVVDGGLTIQLQENLGVRQARFIRQHPEIDLPP